VDDQFRTAYHALVLMLCGDAMTEQTGSGKAKHGEKETTANC
jgi:hypothetical protein